MTRTGHGAGKDFEWRSGGGVADDDAGEVDDADARGPGGPKHKTNR